VQNATVVAGLMAGGAGFFLENRDAGARIAAKQLMGGRETYDSGADNGNFHMFSSVEACKNASTDLSLTLRRGRPHNF
jgi:hypothetical protein